MKQLALGLLLTSAAVAAAETNPIYLHQLPWLSILIAGLIAIWGGLTRTTTRKLTREELAIQAFKDGFVAAGCGFLAFNLAMWAQFNIWLMASFIYIAGWLGARFLSAVGDRFLEAVKSVGKDKE